MKIKIGILALVVWSASLCLAQSNAGQQGFSGSSLSEAFVGKQVLLKIDMPGTQKGIDLHFDRGEPLESKDYEQRIRDFGAALHRGDRATVTSLVVKKDMIEFHLDGGGYGTVHDDTGPVTARVVPKSDEQQRLEKALKTETDKDRRHDLQEQIDREDARRRQEQSREDAAAQAANQIKQQQIADRRLHGGSRFNLRWNGSIPDAELSPDALRARLAAYVDFDLSAAPAPQPVPQPVALPAPGNNGSLTALHRGMTLDDLQNLLGPGRIVSQQSDASGLLNQEMLFVTGESQVHVTLINGVLVRYTVESR
jgi:hypothetical protein